MIRLTHLLDRPLDADEAARVVRLHLNYDERVKTRLATMSADGRAVAILLADAKRGTALRGGTVLAGTHDDGSGALAIVESAPQPVARITARSSADGPLALLRATYHLANRHVPAQLAADSVLIERDPVLEAMLHGLGVQVEHVQAPFDPEGGAYAGHGNGGHHHHGPSHREEIDAVSATVGEQLSIAAHARPLR